MKSAPFLIPTLLVALLSPALRADEPVDYQKQIKPIFKQRCVTCHGGLKQKGGLRLDTAALVREGGDNGSLYEPGKKGESLLLQRVTANDPARRMPPTSEGEPLTAQQIDLLHRWLAQGAKGPANEKKEEDPRDHWAFRKVVRPTVPSDGIDKAWTHNPIDAFLAAEHAKQGLKPQPPASLEHQLRRVYLDLIGLPPTREELHAFLQECNSAKPHATEVAYEKVVDRLLASPQYGERWGRHWMDVWRYSDWYGRRHVPDVWNSAPQIWRWRAWIVNSLNADKGYDRMIQEMLAADEIAPGDDEAAVATGYLVRNWYALNPHQWMRDNVEHTGKAFLGLTFNCCHCHDHKYDPISQEEYFRFRAFFEGIDLRQDRLPGEGDPGPFQKYDYSVLRKIAKLGLVRIYDDKVDAKTFMYSGGDERNKLKDRPPVRPGGPAFLGGDNLAIDAIPLPVEVYYPALKKETVEEETAARKKSLADAESLLQKNRLAHAQSKQQEVAASEVSLAEARRVSRQTELDAYLARVRADRIRFKLDSGDVKTSSVAASKAERAAARAVSKEKALQAETALAQAKAKVAATAPKERNAALKSIKLAEQQLDTARKALAAAEKTAALESDKYTPLGLTFPTTSSGRRKALAEWIANPNNPLTARVAVNHMWMRHFDRPLVESVFDFGRNGKRPSHPALLDWLAAEFMNPGLPSPVWGEGPGVRGGPENGDVPQAAPRVRGAPKRGDQPQTASSVKGPAWSMKHLHKLIVTSQTYRMQSAAGANPSLAKDPDNRFYWHANARRLEAEAVRDSLLHVAGELDLTLGGPTIENTEELKSKRRSLYFALYPEDGGHLKFLELFDAPDACECYRRADSVMPQQALALTNNELAVSMSRILAKRLSAPLSPLGRGAGGEGRSASRNEKPDTDETFITAAFEQILSRGPNAKELEFCRGFLSKQRELYQQAGPQPLANADPVLRSRESLVRALFSHNDFVTVR